MSTPAWQAPDEPAHFNYVRDLAQGNGFPVLQAGDYDQAYLERITAAKFPPDMPVDSIRYESHQPPLYYLLETPAYDLASAQPLSKQVLYMRLFSLLFGAMLLVIVFRTVRQIFPGEGALALGVTALVAFIPQHLHIAGSINNDTMGEMVLSLVLLLLLIRLPAPTRTSFASFTRLTLPLGLALGIALLVKDTAYIAVPLVAIGLLLGELLTGTPRWPGLVFKIGATYIIALAVSGWWFVRNVLVYGNLDLFGLVRHDQVVVGQPRVGIFDWTAAGRFVTVGFRSFWAQFGWMGVPSDSRTYAFAAAFTVLAAAGVAVFLALEVRRRSLSAYQRAALVLMAAAFLLILAGVLKYNLEFIQPQGRYFYPALLSGGLFAYLGLRQFMGRHPAIPTALISVALFVLAAYNLWKVLIPGLR